MATDFRYSERDGVFTPIPNILMALPTLNPEKPYGWGAYPVRRGVHYPSVSRAGWLIA
jgi:hypothetical protein